MLPRCWILYQTPDRLDVVILREDIAIFDQRAHDATKRILT